jgi:kinesin family protein 2/24
MVQLPAQFASCLKVEVDWCAILKLNHNTKPTTANRNQQPTNKHIHNNHKQTMGRKSLLPTNSADATRLRIERMEADREQRRIRQKEVRLARTQEEQRNLLAGNPGDVDFIGLVREWRQEHEGLAQPHGDVDFEKICVCVRKRPLNEKERAKRDHDSVTCLHPMATVHSAKLRVDGISKYLDHNSFRFDHAFDEETSTEEVYRYMAKPLVDWVCGGRGARATVFAYGQTGSGAWMIFL